MAPDQIRNRGSPPQKSVIKKLIKHNRVTHSQSKKKYDYPVCSSFNFVLLLGVALHLSTFVTHFDRSRENTLEYWTVNHENPSLISKSFFLCKTLLRDRSPIIALSCQSLTDWFTIYSLLILWCVSRPLPNKTKLKFDQDFKACWSFCLGSVVPLSMF